MSSFSSSDATAAEAKHVGVRQPPLDAVNAAEQDLDERHEDSYHDALVANTFATRGETHQRPLRQ